MGKSKNKKSKKSEVDDVGGRYKIKYDEDGNMSLEKVASEEEVLNELFSAVNKNKSNEIPEGSDIYTSFYDTMDELLSAIDVPYKIRNEFPSSKIDKAMSEFHTLSPETQELCLNDNLFRGILLTVNAFNEIIRATLTNGPVEAESYTELLNELYRIETFYKNNSNDIYHKKLN